jgi:hypothetical protein
VLLAVRFRNVHAKRRLQLVRFFSSSSASSSSHFVTPFVSMSANVWEMEKTRRIGGLLAVTRSRASIASDAKFGYRSSPPCMDYEIQHSTRRCATTGREFAPGETYYSVLVGEGAELKRYDYAAEAWKGPPEEAIGWWKSQVPQPAARKKHWAPNDVMLHFWDELAEQTDKWDMRYVLTLLLVRRRVFRLEEEKRDAGGPELLVVYCPRRETTYEVPAVTPSPPRVEQIQEELAALLQ